MSERHTLRQDLEAADRYGALWMNQEQGQVQPVLDAMWRLNDRQVTRLNRRGLKALVVKDTQNALYAAVGVAVSAGNEADYRAAAEMVMWAGKRLTRQHACPESPQHALVGKAQRASLQAATRLYAV